MSTLQLVTGDTAAGDTEPRRVPARGTADGKLLVQLDGGSIEIGEVQAGLTEQETADAFATAPTGTPAAGSATDYLKRVAEAAEDTDPVSVAGIVTLSNPPGDPPSAPAIGDDLRGGAKLPANILMGLGGAKRVNAQTASARVQLATSGIVGVSITAIGADIRYALGDSSVDASATSHYLPQGQSRDFRVATSQYIAAIRAGDTDGVLEITELAA